MRHSKTLEKRKIEAPTIEAFTDSLFLDSTGKLIENLRPLAKLIAETYGD
jgi:hypothetical protein